MAEPVILVVSDAVARHLGAALRLYVRELRRDGVPVPMALSELAIAASSGQARPTLDGPADAGDHPGMDPFAVDFRAAGDLLGVSDRSVRRLVRAGELTAVPIGGCKRIRVADLKNYLAGLPAVDKEAA
jgi:excisionase family DNA binding protein